MKGLRREKTKNTLPTADELSTRPHSRAILVKPELDFAAAVEKGKRIKENIRKKYEESFALERTEEEARFAREVLTASTTTPAASRRGAVSLKEGSSLVDGHIAVEPFTADDSFVPVNPRIGVFPIADTKCFPHRRKSTGWEVGLRNYQKKDVVDASIRPFSTVEAIQPPIVEKVVEVAPPVVTKAPVVLEERKPSNSGIQRQESLRTKLKSSNRTTVEPIHEPSMEEQQKYFGEQAKLKFQATYHQLSSQADSLLGGFDTLHEVVKATEMNNVLVVAYNALEQEGVLTPREMRRARTAEARPTIKRGPKSAMKPSERLKPLNLTPLHIDVPADAPMTPPDAPNSVSSGHSVQSVQWNDVVDSQPTDIESSLHQRRTKASERLDDHSYDDISGELSYNLGSPRAIFLSGCLKHSLPPRAQVILRKRTSSTINLSHMGIGNQMAMVLAESLHDLPYLQVLNLCDNNLEDSGLSALLRSIKKHPTIEILDISQNIIDSEAAAALADLIGNPDCRLRCLRMSDANIDDSECARFVQVLMHNRHLQELDMSKNLLGKDENLNAVQPDFETGGESLAELIRVGTCPLQTLNLHWNMIRLEGAEVLCDSIRYNQHLINLDLSYNALGRSAASVLGATLFENRTLQTINVANNGIDAVGSFALFVGLRENQVVRSVVVDGNPIGEQGARMLMKLAASEGHRLEVSAKNCDFAVRSADVRLSIDDPFGDHVLNLSKPYDRAILFELLDIVSMDTNIEIASFEFSDAPSRPGSPMAGGGGGKPEQPASPMMSFSNAQFYRVVRFEEDIVRRCTAEEAELRHLKTFDRLAEMDAFSLRQLLESHDTHRTGYLTQQGVRAVLQALAVRPLDDIQAQVFFTLDPQRFGRIEIDELVEYMATRVKVVQQRMWQLQHRPRCALQLLQKNSSAGSSGKFVPVDSTAKLMVYRPPSSGFVRVKVIESYDCSHSQSAQSYPLCASKCQQVIKIANMSTNPVLLLTYAIESSKLYLEEAQTLYNEIIAKSDDPTPLLAKVLMRMLHASEAKRMIRCFVGDDVVKVRRLKQKLGAAYNPLVGIYSGFYCLDLSQDLDRVCLKKLIERSVRVVESRRAEGLWDTSQHGLWSCFRNELHYDRPEAVISPKFFYPIPHKGKLDFDFVHIGRPSLTVCRPAADDEVVDTILLSRLVPEEEREWVINRMREFDRGVRRAFVANGSSYWQPDLAMAHCVGESLNAMYTGLTQRRETRRKALKRELIKTAIVVEKKEKKKDAKGGRTSYFSSSASLRKSNSVRALNVPSDSPPTVPEELDGASSPVTTGAEGSNSGGGGGGSGGLLAAYSQRQAKAKEVVRVYKPLTIVGPKSEKVQRMWGQRLFEVMESSGSDEYKSATLLDFFESELCHVWLLCKHVAVLLEVFAPIGLAPRSNLGSYRVELVVMVFDRLLDLRNFDLILSVLNSEEVAALRARIGILNFFNPGKPEGGHSFDLSRWEERQVVKMLVHMSVIEPGENWLNKQFIFDRGFAPVPGWDLSVTWLTEEGLPKKGLLSFEFFAGAGLQLLGCKVDLPLRTALYPLVLMEQRDYYEEILAGDMLRDEGAEGDKEGPLRKLRAQQNLIYKLSDYVPSSTDPSILSLRRVIAEDANRHLSDYTDITWNYTNDNGGKFEPWLVVD